MPIHELYSKYLTLLDKQKEDVKNDFKGYKEETRKELDNIAMEIRTHRIKVKKMIENCFPTSTKLKKLNRENGIIPNLEAEYDREKNQ